MDILRPALLAVALVACAPSLAGFGEIPDAPTSETPDAAVAPDATGGDAAPAEATVRPDTAEDTADASDGAATPDAAPVGDATPEATTDASAETSADVGTDAADDRVRDVPETAVCAATCEGLPHVVEAECINGVLCAIRRCERDFADCNRASADGCETDLSTTLNCRSCGVRCPPRFVCANFGCG